MIDAHVHAAFFDWREIPKDAVYYSDGMRALATAECARRALAGGFTTVATSAGSVKTTRSTCPRH